MNLGNVLFPELPRLALYRLHLKPRGPLRSLRSRLATLGLRPVTVP